MTISDNTKRLIQICEHSRSLLEKNQTEGAALLILLTIIYNEIIKYLLDKLNIEEHEVYELSVKVNKLVSDFQQIEFNKTTISLCAKHTTNHENYPVFIIYFLRNDFQFFKLVDISLHNLINEVISESFYLFLTSTETLKILYKICYNSMYLIDSIDTQFFFIKDCWNHTRGLILRYQMLLLHKFCSKVVNDQEIHECLFREFNNILKMTSSANFTASLTIKDDIEISSKKRLPVTISLKRISTNLFRMLLHVTDDVKLFKSLAKKTITGKTPRLRSNASLQANIKAKELIVKPGTLKINNDWIEVMKELNLEQLPILLLIAKTIDFWNIKVTENQIIRI